VNGDRRRGRATSPRLPVAGGEAKEKDGVSAEDRATTATWTWMGNGHGGSQGRRARSGRARSPAPVKSPRQGSTARDSPRHRRNASPRLARERTAAARPRRTTRSGVKASVRAPPGRLTQTFDSAPRRSNSSAAASPAAARPSAAPRAAPKDRPGVGEARPRATRSARRRCSTTYSRALTFDVKPRLRLRRQEGSRGRKQEKERISAREKAPGGTRSQKSRAGIGAGQKGTGGP